MIWTFLTPNLLSAVMSQRQMQKLKCLLEESCLTVIQSVLEKRGTSVHLWIQAGGDQKGSMQLTKERARMGFILSSLVFFDIYRPS